MQFSPNFKKAMLELYYYPQIGDMALPREFKNLPQMLDAGDPNISALLERTARDSFAVEYLPRADQIIAAIEGASYVLPAVASDMPGVEDVPAIEYSAAENKQHILRIFERQKKAEILLAEFDAILDVEDAKNELRRVSHGRCRNRRDFRELIL